MSRAPLDIVAECFARHSAVVSACDGLVCSSIAKAGQIVVDALLGGRKIMACGNGGSAADAQHFVAELVGRYVTERRALPALALTTDTSILTAVANDYGYEQIFSRQVKAHAANGDVLVALSTSGKSPNVIQAAKAAREAGCLVIGLTGQSVAGLGEHCDVSIAVPATETARIQEIHILALHAICEMVDQSNTTA